MIKSLRKRHRLIWIAWAVLLPVGIVLAWLVIPDQSSVKLLKSSSIELLPVILKSKDAKDYSINIRSNKENTVWQLEWRNKTVLRVPSAVIYNASLSPSNAGTSDAFNPEQSFLIGRIETKGDYVFPLKSDSADLQHLRFILYDFIHDKIIETINL